MFLRKNRKRFDGEVYEYWTLCESVRTERGPRQRVVASLGKFTEEDLTAGWDELEALLDGRKPAPRQRRLGESKEVGQQEPRWEQADVAAVLTVGKFCGQASELGIAEQWYARTALEDLCGIAVESVNDDRLYRALDKVGVHEDRLCEHLMDRYRDWFGVRFEFLLYDVTSTYFEGQALKNDKAARGYSRDSRGDCKQVCIGLRPIFHQKTSRVEAHLLICFLSLALWRSLEMWMSAKRLGSRAGKLIEAVGTIRSMDVVVPVKREQRTVDLRMRTVAKPDQDVALLLAHLGLQLPKGSKLVQNVVEKNAL